MHHEKTIATKTSNGLRRCLLTGAPIPKGEPVLLVRVSKDQSAAITRQGLVDGIERLTAYLKDIDWLRAQQRPAPKRSRKKVMARTGA